MSLNRYAKRRDAVEPGIVEVLRKSGCSVALTDQPMDLLIGYRGKTYIGECKDPSMKGRKNEYTKKQQEFFDTWRGGPVVTLRSPEDAINWLKVV